MRSLDSSVEYVACKYAHVFIKVVGLWLIWHIYPNASYEKFRLVSRMHVACKYAHVFVKVEDVLIML